jgi:hypothetical protein
MPAKTTTVLTAMTCAVILLLGACTPKTKLGASWKDPDYTKGRIKKILVIGIAATERGRETFENQFMTTFRNAGIAAEASHNLIPDVEKLTKEIVDAAIEGKDFDTAIVTRLIDIDLNYDRSPGGYTAYPVGGYYNSLYGYYGHAWSVVRAPDQVEYKEIYSLETNIYEISSEKLVWTVQSQAVRKESAYDSIKTFTSLILGRLKSDGFV